MKTIISASELEIENIILDFLQEKPNKNNKTYPLTDKNRRNGVRRYILNNAKHIKGFYNKETQFDNIEIRINHIIRLYTKCETKSLRGATLRISYNFNKFIEWFKQLK